MRRHRFGECLVSLLNVFAFTQDTDSLSVLINSPDEALYGVVTQNTDITAVWSGKPRAYNIVHNKAPSKPITLTHKRPDDLVILVSKHSNESGYRLRSLDVGDMIRQAKTSSVEHPLPTSGHLVFPLNLPRIVKPMCLGLSSTMLLETQLVKSLVRRAEDRTTKSTMGLKIKHNLGRNCPDGKPPHVTPVIILTKPCNL